MPITTTDSMRQGGALSSKVRCWDCNEAAPAFIFESDSGHPICGDCAQAKGISFPIEPSSDPIGTIEKRRRGRKTKTS